MYTHKLSEEANGYRVYYNKEFIGTVEAEAGQKKLNAFIKDHAQMILLQQMDDYIEQHLLNNHFT